ncbi:uncharacterized protein LOC117592506 [Drosophila guanche]|nr:uncharacterized protein LOC117592506 [Drosophila guanche]
MDTYYWIFLIIFLPDHGHTAKISHSNKRLSLLWKSFSCATNPDHMGRHKCFILDNDKSIVSSEFEYLHGVAQMNATFKLFLPRPPFKEYHKMIDLNVDVCQFSKGLYGHKFISVIVRALGSKASLQLSCPRPKGLYSYTNISVAEHLPAFLPETEFKIEINFLTPVAYLINASLHGVLYDASKKRE